MNNDLVSPLVTNKPMTEKHAPLGYFYETHLHTNEASACALSSGKEMAVAYKNAGYSGIFVTDHFFNGNTAISPDLPWGERVEQFCKGYENAKEEGDRIGLSVFLGWEYGYKGTEFLTVGLGKEFLLSFPEILQLSIFEYFALVHENGGFIIHAHPFREAFYIRKLRLFPEYVDAIEGINASHLEGSYDQKAIQFAKENNLPITSGSDAHRSSPLLGGGMLFKDKINSGSDFASAMREARPVTLMNHYMKAY